MWEEWNFGEFFLVALGAFKNDISLKWYSPLSWLQALPPESATCTDQGLGGSVALSCYFRHPLSYPQFLFLQIKTCKALYHKSKANRSMKRQLYRASEVSQRFPSQLYISSGIDLGAKLFWQSFNTFMPVIWQRKRTLRCLTCSSGLF